MERKQLSFKVKFLYGDQKSMRNTHIYIYVGSYVNELLYTRVNEHKQQINIQREGVERQGGGGGNIVRKSNCY